MNFLINLGLKNNALYIVVGVIGLLIILFMLIDYIRDVYYSSKRKGLKKKRDEIYNDFTTKRIEVKSNSNLSSNERKEELSKVKLDKNLAIRKIEKELENNPDRHETRITRYPKMIVFLVVILLLVEGYGLISNYAKYELLTDKHDVKIESNGLELSSYSVVQNKDESKYLIVYLKNISEDTIKKGTVLVQNCDLSKEIYNVGPGGASAIIIDISNVNIDTYELNLVDVER